MPIVLLAVLLPTGFKVQGSGFRVRGSGFRVHGSGFRVQGSGFRVQGAGLGLRALGLGCGVSRFAFSSEVPGLWATPLEVRGYNPV